MYVCIFIRAVKIKQANEIASKAEFPQTNTNSRFTDKAEHETNNTETLDLKSIKAF